MYRNAAELFAYINLFLFAAFIVYYDAIEIPNSIGYASLALAIAASLPYYFHTDRDSSSTIRFGFLFCLGLIAIGHNANFALASDYRGQYEIEEIRPAPSHREYWKVRLENNKSIDIKVSEPPSAYSATIHLRKGLFGVYFGTWQRTG